MRPASTKLRIGLSLSVMLLCSVAALILWRHKSETVPSASPLPINITGRCATSIKGYEKNGLYIVDFTLHNESNHTCGFAESVGMPSFGFGVLLKNPDGSAVAKTAFGNKYFPEADYPIGGSFISVVIKPHQSIKIPFVLSRIYDVSLGGAFRLRVKRSIEWDDGMSEVVQSPTSSIAVPQEPFDSE